jgi:hypothetical protein
MQATLEKSQSPSPHSPSLTPASPRSSHLKSTPPFETSVPNGVSTRPAVIYQSPPTHLKLPRAMRAALSPDGSSGASCRWTMSIETRARSLSAVGPREMDIGCACTCLLVHDRQRRPAARPDVEHCEPHQGMRKQGGCVARRSRWRRRLRGVRAQSEAFSSVYRLNRLSPQQTPKTTSGTARLRVSERSPADGFLLQVPPTRRRPTFQTLKYSPRYDPLPIQHPLFTARRHEPSVPPGQACQAQALGRQILLA